MDEKRKVGRPRSVKPVAEAPPEGIELQIEGFMFNVLAAMEKKIAETIESYQHSFTPPVVGVGAVPTLSQEEQKRQAEVDKINAERLGSFQKDKKDMEERQIAEARQRGGK